MFRCLTFAQILSSRARRCVYIVMSVIKQLTIIRRAYEGYPHSNTICSYGAKLLDRNLPA